ncbi:MAG: hypothetical protein U9P14_07555 [Gemmatimonadota bacterium]|nr:hypothetical protein [Gemmatimonadota bacterium]
MKISRKKLLITAAMLLLALVFLPFFSLAVPGRARDYVYRTYLYQVIAEDVAGGSRDCQQAAERIFDFVYNNLWVVRNEKAVDATPLNGMVRGIAWCDQQSNVFAQLLGFRNIEAGMIMLRGKKSVSGHTVAYVRLEGHRRIVDPLFGVILKDKDGNIARFEDIQNKNSLFSSRLKGQMDTLWMADYCGTLFAGDHPPTVWSPPAMKVKGLRKALRQMVVLYYRLFGKACFNLYQDTYMALARNLSQEKFNLSRPDEKLYYRARNCQLCGRYRKAVGLYNLLLKKYPESSWADRACVFRQAALMKQGFWDQAARGLESYLERKGTASWAEVARYYLDWCRYCLDKAPLPAGASDVDGDAFYFRRGQ